MKQKPFFSSIVIAAILFMNTLSYGQSTEEEVPQFKVFGIGMHIEQFKLNDINTDMSFASPNKIVFTITPSKRLRLEPEIGFMYYHEKENDLKSQSLNAGIGGFGMFQRGKTNIYGGLRFEYARITDEYLNYKTVETVILNRFTVEPVIGSEYYFSQHFSIGGEVGLKFLFFNAIEGQYLEDANSFTTDSGLLLRFYF